MVRMRGSGLAGEGGPVEEQTPRGRACRCRYGCLNVRLFGGYCMYCEPILGGGRCINGHMCRCWCTTACYSVDGLAPDFSPYASEVDSADDEGESNGADIASSDDVEDEADLSDILDEADRDGA